LHAAVRYGGGILACGDAGSLVLLKNSETPKLVRVCEADLWAVLTPPDGPAVAVGGGGFVFRVWPTLEFKLDAIQTTRDLFCVARGPDGKLWCAGAGGRILRRESDHWMRVGAGAEGRIRALQVNGHRVLAFCDDGSAFEGVAK
jgi:hypothetical protein